MVSSVHGDLNSESGFSLNPVPVSHRGRDVCGFPTGMRRPDPCTTHYTPHTLHYARYTTLDTPLYSIIHDHTHAQYTQYSIHTDTTVVVMLGGEGGSGPARWSRNWFCPAAQGQIPLTTQSNLLHYKYRDKYDTLQRQIRYITESNPLYYRDQYTRETTIPGTQYYTG